MFAFVGSVSLAAAVEGVSPETLNALTAMIKAAGASGVHQGGISAEYLKAIADLVGAVAWPVLAVTGIVIFRKELVGALGKVESVKAFGAEFKIKQELNKSGSDVEAAKVETKSTQPSAAELDRALVVETLAAKVDLSVILRQAEELAAEYEGIRASVQAGDTRTRQMEVVIAKMRTIGRAFYPLRHDFARAASAGKRLMVIAALQVDFDFDMLKWICERVGTEKPFVAYHALVAILSAVRSADAASHIQAIELAIADIDRRLDTVDPETDRIRLLQQIKGAFQLLQKLNPPRS